MPFLGNQPSTGYSTIVKDDFTANGNDTVFTLSRTAASANSIAVFVGNVRQEPTDAYTVNGTTLTMSAAPANGANFYVLHISGAVENSSVPASGTIGTSQLANNAVTSAKLDTNIAIDGDLTVDTNTLYVDSTNNRVGIGTTSPAMSLHVEGSAAANNLSIRINNTDTSGFSSVQLGGVDAGIYRNGSTQTAYGGASSLNLITVDSHPISFSTANTERMRIDSAGSVTMPYQPAFVVNFNGFTTPSLIPSSAWTNVQVNRGSHFSTSTGRFVAPVGGVYVFFAGFLENNTNTVLRGDFFINGSNMKGNGSSQYRTSEGYSGYNLPSTHTGMFNLSANDYVEYYVGGSGSVYSTSDDSYNIFGGYLLG